MGGMNPLYIGLGVACVGMLLAILWLQSRGKRVAVVAVSPTCNLLEPSRDQKVMGLVRPIFDDAMDKELAASQHAAMYAAYKTSRESAAKK